MAPGKRDNPNKQPEKTESKISPEVAALYPGLVSPAQPVQPPPLMGLEDTTTIIQHGPMKDGDPLTLPSGAIIDSTTTRVDENTTQTTLTTKYRGQETSSSTTDTQSGAPAQPPPVTAKTVEGLYGHPNSETVVNQWGQTVTTTVQLDGTIITVTRGGGSDGADKPWTKTEILFPAETGRQPIVDYGEQAVTTGYVFNEDGSTTRLVDRNGILEVQISGIGEDKAPWKQIYAVNPEGVLTTTTEANGLVATENSANPGEKKYSTRNPDGSDSVITTRNGIVVAIDEYGLDPKGKFRHTQTTVGEFGLTEQTEFDFPQPGAKRVTVTQGDGSTTSYYEYPDGSRSPASRSSIPPDGNGVQGAIDLVQGIGHDINILGDLAYNRLYAPLLDMATLTPGPDGTLHPMVTHRAPEHSTTEEILAGINIGLLVTGGLDVTLSVAERAAAQMIGRRAATAALAEGMSREEAMAAARAAIDQFERLSPKPKGGSWMARCHTV